MIDRGHNGGPAFRDAGWYATHRDMLNHPIVGICQPVKPADPKRGSASRFEAWHWLIANASYGEREWMNKGQRQTIQPGQLVAGRAHLAHAWNWTEKTIRVFLKQLLDEQMITIATDSIRGQQRANTANIVTLCNYLRYQLSENDDIHHEGPAKGQPRASKGPAKGHIENKVTRKQVISDVPNGTSSPGSVEPGTDVFDPREFNRRLVAVAFADYIAIAKSLGLTEHSEKSLEQLREDMVRRMREHADDPRSFESMIGVWRRALERINISAHCQGQNDRGWKADLNFICQKSSFRKLLDGTYGNGAHASGTAGNQKTSADKARHDAILRQMEAIVSGGRS